MDCGEFSGDGPSNFLDLETGGWWWTLGANERVLPRWQLRRRAGRRAGLRSLAPPQTMRNCGSPTVRFVWASGLLRDTHELQVSEAPRCHFGA